MLHFRKKREKIRVNDGHYRSRAWALRSLLNNAGPRSLCLIGDSNIEWMPAFQLDDRPIVNAGMAGAKATDCLRALQEVELDAFPETTVLLIGTNDAILGTEIEKFASAYRDILSQILGWKSRTIVVAIPPIETAVASPDLVNKAIHQEAISAGCEYIDPFINAKMPMTHDGYHLNIGGMKRFRETIFDIL